MMKDTIIKYWIEKAHEDIGSALDNFSAGRLQNAIRDAYFACFHAVAALLFKEGQTFKKHKEVRSALHRDLIRVGKINASWGSIMIGFLKIDKKRITAHLLNSIGIRFKKSSIKLQPF